MAKSTRGREREVILALLGDKPVAFHPMLAHVLGGVKMALFVSQLLYWHDKGQSPEGWIWKTQAEFEEETGLSRREQETARKHLCALGVLEEKLSGIPARLHYRLNTDRLLDLISEKVGQQNGTNPPDKDAQTDKQDCTNAPNKIVQTVQSITENTTESITSSDNKLSEEEAPPQKSLLQRFNELMTLLESDINGKDRNAAVVRFYTALFGREAGKRPPYSRVGKLCKQYGHARVAQVLWEVVSKSPRGDPLSYAEVVLKGKGGIRQGREGVRKYWHGFADPNDPDIRAWLERKRKHEPSDHP